MTPEEKQRVIEFLTTTEDGIISKIKAGMLTDGNASRVAASLLAITKKLQKIGARPVPFR